MTTKLSGDPLLTNNIVFRAIAVMLFSVVAAWATWVTNVSHATSLKQEKLDGQMETINYKLDLLLYHNGLIAHKARKPVE